MDEFTQTGAQQDDLFDDIQYDESMQTRAPDDLFTDEIQPMKGQDAVTTEEKNEESTPSEAADPVPAPAPVAPVEAAPTNPPPSRGRGGRGRGRGRGRNNPDTRPKGNSGPSEQPPTNSETTQQPASTAVRGDRTATGGLRKPKLTEQELAEKMSRISLKNAALTAAHARAEADAASFAEREEEAAKRRKEERRDRQQMMGEREKNRLRKLKAIGGREWDAEKPEDADAFGGPRQGGGRGRGAHGGVAGQRGAGPSGFGGDKEDYTDGREYMYREDRGRGRGRGGRGGRGGGRGGAQGAQQEKQQQAPPSATDFPDLPASSTPASKFDAGPPPAMAFPTKAKAEVEEQMTPGAETPGAEKKSWADMME